jgi:hypothetical protein
VQRDADTNDHGTSAGPSALLSATTAAAAFARTGVASAEWTTGWTGAGARQMMAVEVYSTALKGCFLGDGYGGGPRGVAIMSAFCVMPKTVSSRLIPVAQWVSTSGEFLL